jgi:hypothetical protein
VIHSAGRDRIVPPRYQRLVIDAYAGPKQVVTVADADHVFTLSPDEAEEYLRALHWLRQRSTVLAERSPAHLAGTKPGPGELTPRRP